MTNKSNLNKNSFLSIAFQLLQPDLDPYTY